MALFPLQPGLFPLGQFDALDSDIANVLGGEVMTLTSAGTSETSAYDDTDGYHFDVTTPITNHVASVRASTASQFPLFLSDDGTKGYGTLFGQTIGTTAGRATTGTDLGPSTQAASGKVTLWDKHGLYAVSIDAVASDFITSISTGASGGLTPGAVLGFTNVGKLAHVACSGAVAGSGVANFVEFDSATSQNASPGSLVNTPNRLVGATVVYNRVVLHFSAGVGVRTL